MKLRGIVLGFCAAAALIATDARAIPFTADPPPPMSLAEPAGRCRPIDFSGLEVEWSPVSGIHMLTISGNKPYANMEVSLSHRSYYGRPQWWRTTVVGCLKSFGIPIHAPYWITMPLDQFVGTKGVEIVGAEGAARKAVPRR